MHEHIRAIDPLRLLFEWAGRVLKRGSGLVLSTFTRDAGIRVHLDGLADLRAGWTQTSFGRDAGELGKLGRWYRDSQQLAALVRSVGLRSDRSLLALGQPPQAAVLLAYRK